jgi:hypothetical protein
LAIGAADPTFAKGRRIWATRFVEIRAFKIDWLTWVAAEEFGDEGDGALSGGESNAVGALVGDGVEALKGDCQMGSALVVGEGVDFIDDDGVDVAQSFAAAGGGEQDVERLRSGDQNVRRQLQHAGTVAGGSVSGADHGAYGGHEKTPGGGELLNLE